MEHMRRIVFVVLVVLIWALPVMAAESVPADEPVVPAAEPVVLAEQTYLISEWGLSVVLFVVGALLVLLGGSLAALYKSAPNWTGSLVSSAVSEVLDAVAKQAEKTTNTVDDEMVKAIRAIIAQEILVYADGMDTAKADTGAAGSDPVPSGG